MMKTKRNVLMFQQIKFKNIQYNKKKKNKGRKGNEPIKTF